MKTTFHLIILKAIIFLGTNILASDSYHVTRSNGYHYTINDSGAYQWASVENAVPIEFPTDNAIPGFNRDDDITRISIGFSCNYFGKDFDTVVVSTNGTLSFDGIFNAKEDRENTSLIGGPENMIAPFWEDLYVGKGVILLETKGDIGNRECIITWHNVGIMYAPAENGIYFQAILRESTGEILFNYHNVRVGDPMIDNGITATVGLTNQQSNIVSQYSHLEPKLYNGLTLVFTPSQGNGLPAIVSPTNGEILESNTFEVEWDPADIIPKEVFLGIGTSLERYDIGHVKITPDTPIYTFNGMPTDGSDLFLNLFIQDEQNQYQSNVILKTADTDELEFRGIVMGFYNIIYIEKPVVTLRSLDENFNYLERMRVGTAGSFHFSDLKPGRYEFRALSDGHYFLTDGYYSEEINLTQKTTHRSFDFRNQIIDAHPTDGQWLGSNKCWYRLRHGSFSNLLLVLKDANGNEIERKELGSQREYKDERELEVGKTYFWDLYSRNEDGEVKSSIENRQFQIQDPDIPSLITPVSCPGKTYSHRIQLRWDTGTIPVQKWRIIIRENENSPIFYSKEYGVHEVYDAVTVPSKYETCYIQFSYFGENGWVSQTSKIELQKLSLKAEILSPEPNAQISDEGLGIRFKISGPDSKYLYEKSLSIQLMHNNKPIFDSGLCNTEFERLENGEYYYKIGALPSMGENIELVLKGSLHTDFEGYPSNQYMHFYYYPFDHFELKQNLTCPLKSENVSGYDFSTYDYDWIDATNGIRLPLKGAVVHDHNSKVWYIDVETPFPINYYGASYNSIRIMENGIISFSHALKYGDDYYSNFMLNTNYPNNVVAPFATGLNSYWGGGIYHHTTGVTPHRKFVIQWNRMNSGRSETEEAYTFQIVFTENSDDIIFQYKDVDYDNEAKYQDFGAGSVIGLKNQDGTKSTIYSIKSSSVNNETAIIFTPR